MIHPNFLDVLSVTILVRNFPLLFGFLWSFINNFCDGIPFALIYLLQSIHIYKDTYYPYLPQIFLKNKGTLPLGKKEKRYSYLGTRFYLHVTLHAVKIGLTTTSKTQPSAQDDRFFPVSIFQLGTQALRNVSNMNIFLL